jgi:hypothetical protein
MVASNKTSWTLKQIVVLVSICCPRTLDSLKIRPPNWSLVGLSRENRIPDAQIRRFASEADPRYCSRFCRDEAYEKVGDGARDGTKSSNEGDKYGLMITRGGSGGKVP